MLSPERGQALCRLARQSIAAALGGPPAEPLASWAGSLAATFVTLHRGEDLQGCIGSLEPRRPLNHDVAENARAAALADPRGGPLALADVPELDVEVSLLSPLERVPVNSEAEAIAALRPGIDGVLLTYGRRRGTFLPQVWETLPSPYEFLARLRVKAGLPPDFWAHDMEVWRYTVEKFVEPHRGAA
jgi:AmmeMemoRadiSam system protein A